MAITINSGSKLLPMLIKTSSSFFLFRRCFSNLVSPKSSLPFLLLQRPPSQLLQTPRRSKFKRVGEERQPGTELQILGARYRTDEWTNVPDKVLGLIGTDLYTRPGNPIYLIAESLRRQFRRHRVYHFEDPVVTTWANFDSILVPPDHISRSRTDTFYIDEGHVLRGHTSAHQHECFQRCFKDGGNKEEDEGKFLIIGDVYRRDEVNRTHHAAFHQAEVAQLYREANQEMAAAGITSIFDRSQTEETEAVQAGYSLQASNFVEAQLKKAIEAYIRRLLGVDTQTRWVDAYFPFTHPSWELEIRRPPKSGKEESADSSEEEEDSWMEMLGCGVVRREILARTGQESTIGWAFGCGLERLAMLYYDIPDIRLFWSRDSGFAHQFEHLEPFQRVAYRPISAYPQKVFDISFWLPEDSAGRQSWSANDVHAIILDIGGEMVEQARLVESWTRPQDGRVSHMYRIVYRSMERALTSAEVNVVHGQIEAALIEQLGVTIR